MRLEDVHPAPALQYFRARNQAPPRHFWQAPPARDLCHRNREFEIGTAKPGAAERARVPHHLVDFVDPAHYITAGEYARQARKVIAEINSRGHLPIVVGGTGLYLRALLEGLFPGPQRSEELRERLRERVATRGSSYLYQILRRLDRAA